MDPHETTSGATGAASDRRGFESACVHALPYAACAADASGLVTVWNPAMELATGKKAAEALGKPIDEAFRGTGELAEEAVHALSSASGGVYRSENPVQSILRADGETALFEVFGIPLANFGSLVLFEDVTERTLSGQASLREARASSLASLGAAIAHEIRNPLNSIALNLQLLKEGIAGLACPEKAELLDDAATVIEEIRRLDRVVGDLLRFARNGAAQLSPGDLNAAVARALRLLSQEAARSGVTIERDLRHAGRVMLDEEMLSRAVYNIALNGIQAMNGGGTLTVRTGVGKHSALVEISDTGPGIPPENREKVFDLFYSKRSGGTGLGLPIAQRIVEAHHGRIAVFDAFGGGAAFQIHLPVLE